TQEDQLFAAPILENVAFFDHNLNQQRVTESLRSVGLYDEITAMPMGLQTLLGDIGINLSGSQKQRLLLARALYKRPDILILDEATSHLNDHNQLLVHDALKRTGKIHVLFAHKEELISSTDRVFILHEGQLIERLSGDTSNLYPNNDETSE
ncbi:MAG: ATP-binding cassette domain-containing protein, partial [Candidatus Thiodiazotropha sp. 6PLUC9]